MKRTLFTRILAGMLAALSLAGLAACSGGGETAETTAQPTQTTPAETEPVETEPTVDQWGRDIIHDDLPADLRFDGETFTILTRDSKGYYYEFFSEETTGDIVGDAIYARNLRVEDCLGVEIEVVMRPSTYTDPTSFNGIVANAIAADTDEFDVVANYAYAATKAANLEYWYNLADLPNVNFEKPWWRQNYIDAATAHGVFFTVIGDLNLSVIDRTMLLYYNKRIAEQYGVGNLYEMVLNGTWTLDKLMEITQNTASDLDGSGSFDEKDFYGLVSGKGSGTSDGWLAAFHIPLVTLDVDGVPQFTFNIDLASQALDKLVTMYFQNNGALVTDEGKMNTKFYAGEAMFWASILNGGEGMMANLRNMTDDYGVIPLPKLTEEQEGYGTIPQDAHNNMAVMRNIKNPEMVGAMLELLNAETWKTVRPEYCENTVKFRYMRDSESGQIFDIIVDSVHFDYATIYNAALDGHGNPYWTELFNSRNQLASTIAANKGTIMARIKVLDKKFAARAEE